LDNFQSSLRISSPNLELVCIGSGLAAIALYWSNVYHVHLESDDGWEVGVVSEKGVEL
jgi:hypothetical protein